MPGFWTSAADVAQLGVLGRRDREDRLVRAASAGRNDSKMIRSNSSGFVSGPYSVGRDAVQLGVRQVRERRLEIRVAVADEEDPAGAGRAGRWPTRGRRPTGRPARSSGSRAGAREPDLDDRRRPIGTSSIETSVRRWGWSGCSRASQQLAVAPQLEPPVGRLDVEVRDRDEHRARHAGWRGPDGERDDRLVRAVAAHLEHADRRVEDPTTGRGWPVRRTGTARASHGRGRATGAGAGARADRRRRTRAACPARRRSRRGSRHRRSVPRAPTPAAAHRPGRRWTPRRGSTRSPAGRARGRWSRWPRPWPSGRRRSR